MIHKEKNATSLPPSLQRLSMTIWSEALFPRGYRAPLFLSLVRWNVFFHFQRLDVLLFAGAIYACCVLAYRASLMARIPGSGEQAPFFFLCCCEAYGFGCIHRLAGITSLCLRVCLMVELCKAPHFLKPIALTCQRKHFGFHFYRIPRIRSIVCDALGEERGCLIGLTTGVQS